MYLLTIAIVLALFLLDIILLTLNYRHRTQPIPASVSDVYNLHDYKQWLSYTMEKFRLSIFSKIVSTAILLVMISFKIFPRLALITDHLTRGIIWSTLLFLGIYGALYYVSSIGFRLFQTFNIEARYGFNTTTIQTFISDQIKGLILGALFGGGLISLLLYLYLRLGTGAIFYAWIITMSIILIMNLLYTRLFIRLFNQLTPLPEGELYEKSTQLASNLGYEIRKISVIDASKRSTKINAYFTGFGRFKSIILYDTLLEKCHTDEIVSVLAHEIGHAKNFDVLKNLLLSGIQIGGYLVLLGFFLSSESFATVFGFESIHYGFAIVLFGILVAPISILLNIPLSAMSRKAEYKADACAADSGYGDGLCSALKVLARENFANLTPHPLVVKLTYSHPLVSQRIEAIMQHLSH